MVQQHRTPTTQDQRDDWQRWVQQETARRRRDELPNRETTLSPPEHFPARSGWFGSGDENARTRAAGEPCPALDTLVHGSCNGWREKPTAAEVERVMKARIRGPRADAIARTVATESSRLLIMRAEQEGGYSLQDLAWWMHELKLPAWELIRWLNAMSTGWMRQQASARDLRLP
ncbi:MAG: hypothetical protein OXQ28_14995 [Acidobacteriota bacterium]|nr:hypothetical protein [Acidobacteriota bacterium]